MLCLNMLPCTGLLLFIAHAVTLAPSKAAPSICNIIHLSNLNLLLLRLQLIHNVNILVGDRCLLPIFGTII